MHRVNKCIAERSAERVQRGKINQTKLDTSAAAIGCNSAEYSISRGPAEPLFRTSTAVGKLLSELFVCGSMVVRQITVRSD